MLGITHPVLLDAEHVVRRAYAVRAWPTLVLVDAAGYIIATVSGEGNRETLDNAIAQMLGSDVEQTFLAIPRINSQETGPLRFPGKVLADPKQDRLFIADTGHHRLVIASRSEQNTVVVGNGLPGLRDGNFAEAQFRDPQGMALSADGRSLYVADSGNHAIRVLDLIDGQVKTIAGTRRQRPGPLVPPDMNAPWDVALDAKNRFLYIAMAGAHQIVQLDSASNEWEVFAGSGREARVDGPVATAAFAQPSGLAIGPGSLFVTDAESSCIRAIDMHTELVATLAGGDLFDFGLWDGNGLEARFQHPGDLTYNEKTKQLYVADTYNHRIRVIDVQTGIVTTLETPLLSSPGGVSIAGESLYIADTNNHRIIERDVRNGATQAISLAGLCAPDCCFPLH